MARLYTKNQRICPNCGKQLILKPPDYDNAPAIMRTNGSKPYYVTAGKFQTKAIKKCRLYRYTSYRHKYTFIPPSSCLSDFNHDNGVYISQAKKLLKHDHIFNTNLIMFCKNCKSNIAVNRNPCRLIRYYSQYPLTLMLLGALISVFWDKGLLLALLGILLQISMFLVSFVYYLIIKHKYSNFVVIDEWDRLVQPSENIVLSISDLKNNFHNIFITESNILSVNLDKETFHLYVVENKVSIVKAHICGIDGEFQRFIAVLQKEKDCREKAILPLMFEGKFIGNAEVIEILQPSDLSSDK